MILFIAKLTRTAEVVFVKVLVDPGKNDPLSKLANEGEK